MFVNWTLTVFTLSICAGRVCYCLDKHWLPDVEWDTKNNWVDGLLPSANSRVEFPLKMKHTAGLRKFGTYAVSEIDLARDGGLALPRQGGIQVIYLIFPFYKKIGTEREGTI